MERKLIASDVILDVQGVPALDLLVLVLQTLVPVLEPLPFSSDPQLTPTCGGDRPGCCPEVRVPDRAASICASCPPIIPDQSDKLPVQPSDLELEHHLPI